MESIVDSRERERTEAPQHPEKLLDGIGELPFVFLNAVYPLRTILYFNANYGGFLVSSGFSLGLRSKSTHLRNQTT